MDGRPIEGSLKPSVDTATHLFIYNQRLDVGGVVHTHSPFATAFAAVGKLHPRLSHSHLRRIRRADSGRRVCTDRRQGDRRGGGARHRAEFGHPDAESRRIRDRKKRPSRDQSRCDGRRRRADRVLCHAVGRSDPDSGRDGEAIASTVYGEVRAINKLDRAGIYARANTQCPFGAEVQYQNSSRKRVLYFSAATCPERFVRRINRGAAGRAGRVAWRYSTFEHKARLSPGRIFINSRYPYLFRVIRGSISPALPSSSADGPRISSSQRYAGRHPCASRRRIG